VKSLFDMDSSSSPDPSPRKQTGASETPEPSAAGTSPVVGASPAPRADPAGALHAARTKLQAARANVIQALDSSPAYRAATADAETAEAELKKARSVYEPGSPELIAASQAALQAHAKVQKLISDAAAKDPASQEAAREVQAALGNR
jgi:hypothetical protein